MNSLNTAIFIEPEGTLLKALHERKAWLEVAMPGQAYCSHPPHSTLLFGAYGDPGAWVGDLQGQLAAVTAFGLETDAWQEFPADTLAGGGHSIAYRVRLSPALVSLQQVVANCLAPYVDESSAPHPLREMEPFASSLRRFGYPYVGAHWIPHFTIASPLLPVGSPLLARLMAGPARHSSCVRSVSVWRVEGDRHQRLHELALAGV